ncbi:MAG: VWA domain-containing protein [Chloroflexi bacterium]|nr:VWA domain-containing protein [Chloroflexota bacterium]
MPIALQEPWALLLLPLAVALLWFTRRRVRALPPWRRRGAVGVRLLLLAAFVGAVAQPLLRMPDDHLSVILAVDVSESLAPEAQAQVAEWLAQALKARGPQDVVGAVAFARDAHVIRPPSKEDSEVLPATVHVDGTDLSKALRLAAALLQGEGARRIVLISDGWPTAGDAEQVLPLLGQIQLLVLPVPNGAPRPEALVERVELPGYVREGETIDTTVAVGSTEETAAVLRVQVDGEPAFERLVELKPGHNTFSLSQRALGPGFHRVAATIQPGVDSIASNNTAASFVVVKGRPRVLLLEERQGEAQALREVLAASGMDVEVMAPARLPSLDRLEPYDAMALGNVSATSFSLDQLKVINAYVESRGHGLVVVGGPTSYALGNYGGTPLEQALPVWASIPTKREGARIALLLIIDRSGSMELKSDGVAKIEMAKEAAILATEALRPGDFLGILAFDVRPRWVVPLQPLDPAALQGIQTQIARLEADGGTDIYTALQRGYEALRTVRADLRHIVLLSDGQGFEAKYEELASQIRTAGIGVSTIAVGSDADTQLLGRLARWGEGRYYFTERVRDIPKIMTREAAIAKRTALVEGHIRPQLISTSPILRSIAPADLPPLGGYVATIPKDTAQVVLATDSGEPLLAQWYFGLGRVVVWTSDLSPRWTSEWLAWKDNQRFWDQAVRWAMPSPANRDLSLEVSRDDARVTLRAEALRDGQFANLAATRATITLPDGRTAQVPLRQTAPGRYEAQVLAESPGVYQVDVVQSDDGRAARQETTGFVVREAEELASFGANERLLRRLASQTGGRVIQRPEEAFARDFNPVGFRWEPLWWRLLLLGLLLLPLDIAVRRLPWPPTRALASLLIVKNAR